MGDLRIIGGEHGSRRISVPPSVARPTTDRVREALFSSLGSLRSGFEGARVLDAFAGSGALGLEALSRGAASACLVERDGRAAKVAAANARALGYSADRARILRADALASAPSIAQAGPFDLVFLDPPYALEATRIRAFLDALAASGALAGAALIAYEHSADAAPAAAVAFADAPWAPVRQKRHGATQLTLLQAR